MTVEEIRTAVRAGGLFDGEDPVLVMLSGGRDSVCLIDVAVALAGSERLAALHVNYGLRSDSDQDERHCRELCAQLEVPLEVLHATAAPAEPTGNLHAWAREVRYGKARAIAARLGAKIATGHTATDQAETILYRLAASPGRRALLGMVPADGDLVRPLLCVTREQTAEYCRERGLAWREDVSNDDPRYARARVRHGLSKALVQAHPAALANVVRTAELLREETEVLDRLVEIELDGRQSISIERLSGLPNALRRMVVQRLAEQAAGTFVPQAGERAGEIVALARRKGRGEIHIGGLVAAVVEAGTLSMERIASRMG